MTKASKDPTPAEPIEVSGPYASAWHALDDPDADLMVAKARLVVRLSDAIKVEGLTQVQAAERLGMAAPNLSRVLSGRFRSVTVDALWKMLRGMGVDVQITASPAAAPPTPSTPTTRETAAAVSPDLAGTGAKARAQTTGTKRAPRERR